MMKKLIGIIILIFFTVPVLSSCYDYKEPNDIAYVVAIGVDEGTHEGVYNFSLQFARPSQISGGSSEEGGSGKETIGMVTVEAPSIYSALNMANHTISKTFTLSHTKIIVLSDKISKKGIVALTDSLGRSSDIRPYVFMCVSNGDAKKYLKSVDPVVEINPVKYYRLMFENPNSSFFPKTTANEVYENFKSGLCDTVMPLVGVANKSQNNSKNESQEGGGGGSSGGSSGSSGGGSGGSSGGGGGSSGGGSSPQSQDTGGDSQKQDEKLLSEEKKIPVNKDGFEYDMKKYIAGEMDIEKQNDSELVGGAVFKEDKMIGLMSNIECEIYNIIIGQFQNAYSVIYSPKSPQTPTTIRLEATKKPNIKVDTKTDSPKILIKLFLEGNFMSVAEDYPIETKDDEFEKTTSQYIKEACEKLLYKSRDEYNSDIFGFSKKAKQNFYDYKSFTAYDWREKYKNASFEVLVEFKIRKTGLTIREGERK